MSWSGLRHGCGPPGLQGPGWRVQADSPYRPPFVLGHDVAGTIVRTGPEVRRFKAGDEVYARPRDHRIGTFAEFIAINEADVALKPKNLNMAEAASIPLVGLTAWQALVEVGKVKPGQKVFIQAGSGGVGTFAIQLAKHLGGYSCDDDEREECRAGQKSRGGCGYRLQDAGFREGPVGLRSCVEQSDPKTLEKSLGRSSRAAGSFLFPVRPIPLSPGNSV